MNHNRNTVIEMRAMRVFASLIFSSFQTDLFNAKKNGVQSNARRKKRKENTCVSESQHLEMGTIFFGISFSQLKVFRNVGIYNMNPLGDATCSNSFKLCACIV